MCSERSVITAPCGYGFSGANRGLLEGMDDLDLAEFLLNANSVCDVWSSSNTLGRNLPRAGKLRRIGAEMANSWDQQEEGDKPTICYDTGFLEFDE